MYTVLLTYFAAVAETHVFAPSPLLTPSPLSLKTLPKSRRTARPMPTSFDWSMPTGTTDTCRRTLIR